MSRLYLAGLGDIIIAEALPDPTALGPLPPFVINLAAGNWDKTDYVGLGYTNFEVLAIGAPGGRGGGNEFILTSGSAGAALSTSYGGGGGGGGLQRVYGLLADLSTLTPVVIGAAGANGSNGNGKATTDGAYVAPQVGGDGGYSSFGGTLCRASGGKGGGVTRANYDSGGNVSDASRYRGGNGGDGGLGGRTTAGGGAAGSSSAPGFYLNPSGFKVYVEPRASDGADGVWNTSTDIGQGGGGGGGGTYADGVTVFGGRGAEEARASSGGKGSYSFAETSFYGPGDHEDSVLAGFYSHYSLIDPGGGGGARYSTTFKYGSHATGYTPTGGVIIRLTKIV